MKLNKIKIINFRGISDMEIEFDKRATVIYGINGMGKSEIGGVPVINQDDQ